MGGLHGVFGRYPSSFVGVRVWEGAGRKQGPRGRLKVTGEGLVFLAQEFWAGVGRESSGAEEEEMVTGRTHDW